MEFMGNLSMHELYLRQEKLHTTENDERGKSNANGKAQSVCTETKTNSEPYWKPFNV